MHKTTLAAAFCIACSSAHAQYVPVLTIDMTTVIHDERNQPIKDQSGNTDIVIGADGKPTLADPTCSKCPPLTLGHMIANALFGADKDQSAADLWARGLLATRIKDDKAAVLTSPEVTLIEKLVLKSYPSPVLIMQVYPAIDPNYKPGEIK